MVITLNGTPSGGKIKCARLFETNKVRTHMLTLTHMHSQEDANEQETIKRIKQEQDEKLINNGSKRRANRNRDGSSRVCVTTEIGEGEKCQRLKNMRMCDNIKMTPVTLTLKMNCFGIRRM